jgi:nucleotide-binding universal stress UspA family protein
MSGRIIVGADASESTRDAVALGRNLCRATGAQLELVAIHPPHPAAMDVAAYETSIRAHEEEILERASELLGGVGRVERRIEAAASPARGLHELAEREDADLIVVGSTHRGRMGRVLPGSVGARLLHGSPCPIAVAPRGYWGDDPRLRRIGAAYADSPESRAALKAAHALASKVGGSLRVLTAVDPVPYPGAMTGYAYSTLGPRSFDYDELKRLAVEQGEADLAEAVAALPAGVTVERSVLTGEPVGCIVDACDDLDLLFLGSRGYGPLGSVILGGFARQVVENAACPVVVIPRGADVEHGGLFSEEARAAR